LGLYKRKALAKFWSTGTGCGSYIESKAVQFCVSISHATYNQLGKIDVCLQTSCTLSKRQRYLDVPEQSPSILAGKQSKSYAKQA
jgi:hypothetical protein